MKGKVTFNMRKPRCCFQTNETCYSFYTILYVRVLYCIIVLSIYGMYLVYDNTRVR